MSIVIPFSGFMSLWPNYLTIRRVFLPSDLGFGGTNLDSDKHLIGSFQCLDLVKNRLPVATAAEIDGGFAVATMVCADCACG